MWTQSEGWPVNQKPEAWGIKCLKGVTGKYGLSREQGTVHTGHNSGFAAINLAYLLGATRIILIGYDMMLHGGKRHWFGDHPGRLNAASNYQQFMTALATIKPADYGIEIWNCSRKTALTCFPIHDLDEVCAA